MSIKKKKKKDTEMTLKLHKVNLTTQPHNQSRAHPPRHLQPHNQSRAHVRE